MDFLFVNTQELSALMGLPHIQQLIYLKGIRPYMDRNTCMVGIKRRISHKQLAEELYVEPHQGYTNSGSPSRPQIKRAVKGLERAGLIKIESDDKHLILKCLLADTHSSVQNKPVPNPSTQPVRNPSTQNSNKSMNYDESNQKPVMGKNLKPVLHHNSENISVYVCERFEKFWASYPQKLDQGRAWEEFKKLNPSDEQLVEILSGLKAQIKHRKELQQAGIWVPKWKYPANWLAQQCWNDELQKIEAKEQSHGIHQGHRNKKSSFDIFWESCGEETSFDLEDNEPKAAGSNVINFEKR